VAFVEAGNMVYDAQPAQLAADGLQHPRAEAVSVAKGRQVGQELTLGILELDKDRKKDLLMVTIARKEKLYELVQPLDSGNLVAVELYLGAWHIFHPCLFLENRAFLGGLCRLDDVKIFSVLGRSLRANRPLPKTLRFRAGPAQHGTFSGIGYLEDGLHIWILGLERRIC
jgi:hypothetical protein